LENSILSEKEYMVLSYILLNTEKPGVFNGSLEEISLATGIPLNEVKYIVTKKLSEKGIIKLYEEPAIDDLQSKIDSYISKIDRRDLNDEYIHQLIQVKDDYYNFDKILRKLYREIKVGDNEINIEPEFLIKLFALNERLDSYRNLLRAVLSKITHELKLGNINPAVKEYVKVSLLFYLMIPVIRRLKLSLDDGLSVQLITPNIHLIKKRIELLDEVAKNISKLLDAPVDLERSRLSIGVIKLFFSLKKEIDILKSLEWVTSKLESYGNQ
jgi:hypothetical protein